MSWRLWSVGWRWVKVAWRRLGGLVYERIVRPILFVQDTPKSKAGGVALGLFIAFTPTVGIQMPIAFATATVFGVNQPLAIAMVWLTNPVTVPPVYYFEYRVGAAMLGEDAIGSKDDFWREWERISAERPGYLDRVLHLAKDIGYPLFLGSLPVALVLAVLGYPLTLWLCQRRARTAEAAQIHPVAGEILPEPTHAEENGDASPRMKRDATGLLLLLAALAPSTQSCTESSNRYTTHERQSEARTEGELELAYAWLDGDTLLAAAPIHAASGRSEFSRARLDALTRADGPRLWIALSIWRFAGDGPPLELGRDGVEVAAATRTGSVASLPPSKLLAEVTDAGTRRMLATLTGEGALPTLVSGHSVQLVAAIQTDAALAELDDLRVTLPERTVKLARARAPALQWDEFRAQPSRARFEAALAATPLEAAGTSKEGAGGDRRDAEK